LIRLQNQNEYLLEFGVSSAGALDAAAPAVPNVTLRLQPTSSKATQLIVPAPVDLQVLALAMTIGTVGAVGNSTTFFTQYKVVRSGFDGTVGADITALLMALDCRTASLYVPAAGVRLIAPAIDPKVVIPQGTLMQVSYVETGTIGTATRPIVIPVGIVVRAAASMDPRDPDYSHV
jgi:hypothetical protein